MAPTKAKPRASKGANKRQSKPSPSGSTSKSKSKSSIHKARNPHKTKSTAAPQKKKRREYTEAELGIPKLNMITPAGVQKPRGKKKGKVFVDDAESMRTILAMVNADKEGQIESKMMKARQMEEIRQARQKEMEKRQVMKKEQLEETKNSIKKDRKKKRFSTEDQGSPEPQEAVKPKTKSKKRVSFV